MKAWLTKWVQQLVLAVGCLLLSVAGISFLSVAAYLALEQVIGAPRAALVVGAGYLLLALMVALIMRIRRSRPAVAPRHSLTKPPDNELDAAVGSMLGRDAGNWLRLHGRKASFAALAAGVAFGASPGLRHFLERVGAELSERNRTRRR